jgi:hypothetical protein
MQPDASLASVARLAHSAHRLHPPEISSTFFLARRREGQVRKATRYEKRAADYLSMVTIASIFIWLRFAEAP